MSKKMKPVFSLKSLLTPASFAMPVTLNHPAAGEVKIDFTVKSMGKKAWAELRDKHIAEAAKRGETEVDAEDADVQLAEIVAQSAEASVDLILEFVTGWSLDDEMTRDALIQLDDICGGTFIKILQTYGDTVFLGKVGN